MLALLVAGCSGSGSTTGGGSGGSGGSGGGVSTGGGTGGSVAGGTGCSVGGGTGGTGGAAGGGGVADAGPSLGLKAFCSQYAAAACALRFACGRYESASSPTCLAREA